ICRVDSEGPGVAAGSTRVRPLPAVAAIAGPGGAVAAGLVGAAGNAWMPREAVDVAGRVGAMIAERRAAVLGEHQPAKLDPHQHELRILRARCDPQHERGPWTGREAPDRA